jgi:hypothetical protein
MRAINLLRTLALFAGISAVAAAHSQGLSRPAPARTSAQTLQATVTEAEAAKVLARMEKVVAQVVRLPGEPRPTLGARSTPVTREQVVRELHRIARRIEPEFKVSPRPIAFERRHLTIAQGERRREIERLIELGLVPPLAPLATATRPTMTVQEFGDAVGYFLTRTAYLTHTPSQRFTPALMPGP